jgi:hypothetical protein
MFGGSECLRLVIFRRISLELFETISSPKFEVAGH